MLRSGAMRLMKSLGFNLLFVFLGIFTLESKSLASTPTPEGQALVSSCTSQSSKPKAQKFAEKFDLAHNKYDEMKIVYDLSQENLAEAALRAQQAAARAQSEKASLKLGQELTKGRQGLTGAQGQTGLCIRLAEEGKQALELARQSVMDIQPTKEEKQKCSPKKKDAIQAHSDFVEVFNELAKKCDEDFKGATAAIDDNGEASKTNDAMVNSEEVTQKPAKDAGGQEVADRGEGKSPGESAGSERPYTPPEREPAAAHEEDKAATPAPAAAPSPQSPQSGSGEGSGEGESGNESEKTPEPEKAEEATPIELPKVPENSVGNPTCDSARTVLANAQAALAQAQQGGDKIAIETAQNSVNDKFRLMVDACGTSSSADGGTDSTVQATGPATSAQ